jgi:hypothetical protein
MNLESLANISQIVGTVTVVVGIGFALVQLSELKKQRRDAVASELMRTFMDSELAHAMAVIKALPDGVSAEELRRSGQEAELAAVLICMRFETMGLLVYQHISPFALVVELAGGIIVVMWNKLGPWVDQIRLEQSRPSWAEWFQWLSQQCDAHKGQSVPAYKREMDWRP